MARRARTEVFESLRAWSRCLLSSRCSGVNANRGGLEVNDLDSLGGVRLALEAWPTELKS